MRTALTLSSYSLFKCFLCNYIKFISFAIPFDCLFKYIYSCLSSKLLSCLGIFVFHRCYFFSPTPRFRCHNESFITLVLRSLHLICNRMDEFNPYPIFHFPTEVF